MDRGRLPAVEQFFAGYAQARRIFDVLEATVVRIGPAEVRVGKSQVAFRRRRNFALAWMPGVYLGPGHAPLVLSVLFRHRDPSPRWKEVVEPYPGRFTHHLELRSGEGQGLRRTNRKGVHVWAGYSRPATGP